MPWLEESQIRQAKEIDLLTYLQENEPHELRKTKYADEYRTATHSSLVISRGLWFWNRGNVGGKTALDFLIKVRGMDFVEAVDTILGSRGVAAFYDAGSRSAAAVALSVEGAKSPSPKVLILPEANPFPKNVVAYLQKRGISPEVINRCLEEGILYESRKNQNAIFVGKDEHCKPRFACQRGTRDDFKADVFGSDKRYSFSLAAETPNSQHLIVFESPIDLLSEATLQQRGDLACGLSLDTDVHRLSLGGTSDVALMTFLERTPAIEQVTLCLDADEAGQTASRKIAAKLAVDSRFEHITIKNCPPQGGAKDYNEALLRAISIERESKQQTKQSGRCEAAI